MGNNQLYFLLCSSYPCYSISVILIICFKSNDLQSFARRGNLTQSILGLPLLQASFLSHFHGPLADYLSLRARINSYLSTL